MTSGYSDKDVIDRKSFSEFLLLLYLDFKENEDSWENNTLESFLEAMHAYSKDIDGYYKNMHPDLDADNPKWRVFADILKGAVVYE